MCCYNIASMKNKICLNHLFRCTEGVFDDHLNRADLCKYLDRGLERMPWSELSQKDFLEHVVKFQETCCTSDKQILLSPDLLVANSIRIMEEAVRNPDRLFNSAYQLSLTTAQTKSKVRFKMRLYFDAPDNE